eukprot:983126-Pyramimonas_sp.AAC.1
MGLVVGLDRQAAIDDCTLALDQACTGAANTTPLITRSMAHQALGDHEKAVADLELAHEMEPESLAVKERLKKAQVRYINASYNAITSFYGSSCAKNGKDALNTPETLPINSNYISYIMYWGVECIFAKGACDASGAKGERSGRKWGTGHRVRRGKGLWGVECALAVVGTGGPVK